jgi:hypothetical protein
MKQQGDNTEVLNLLIPPMHSPFKRRDLGRGCPQRNDCPLKICGGEPANERGDAWAPCRLAAMAARCICATTILMVLFALSVSAARAQSPSGTASFTISGDFQGQQVQLTFVGVDSSLYNSLVYGLQGQGNPNDPQAAYIYDALNNPTGVPLGTVVAQVVPATGPNGYVSPSSPEYQTLLKNALLWEYQHYNVANQNFTSQLNSGLSLWQTTYGVDSTIGLIDSFAAAYYADLTYLIGLVQDAASSALDPNEAQQVGNFAQLLIDAQNFPAFQARNAAQAESVLTVLTQNGVVSGSNLTGAQIITGLAGLTPQQLSTVEAQLQTIVGIQSQNVPQNEQQYLNSLWNNFITGASGNASGVAVGSISAGAYSGYQAYFAAQSLGAESPAGVAWAAGANSAGEFLAGGAVPLITLWAGNLLFQTSVEPQLPLLQDQFAISATLATNLYPEIILIGSTMYDASGLPYFAAGNALTTEWGEIVSLDAVYDQINYVMDPVNYGPPTGDQQNLVATLTLLSNAASSAQTITANALATPAPVVNTSQSNGGIGDEFTLSGGPFTGTVAVFFGNEPAWFQVNSASSISTAVPAGSGTVDIMVVTAGGLSQTGPADKFTYGPATPPTSIDLSCSVTPDSNVMPNSLLTVSGTANYNNNGGPLAVGTVYISLGGQAWTAPIKAGNFNDSIYAPTNSGTFSVSCQTTDANGLTASCSSQISVQANGSSSSYNNVILLTCDNINDDYPWNFVDALPGYSTTLQDLYAWCELQNVYGGHSGEFKIYNPSGVYEGYADFTIPNATTEGYQYWSWYDVWNSWVVQGDALSSEPGLWTLVLYIDGAFVQTIPFIMAYDMYEQVMCKSVEESSPYNPINRQNVFQSTDPEAVAWTQLGTVSDPLQVKYVWTQPNGSVYSTYTNAIPAPPASELYYQSYKSWCYINIAGSAAANDCGNWQVDVYISDNNGPWQKQYSDYFQIVKNPAEPPTVSVSASASTVVAGQPVTINVTAADTTYLQTVSLYWFDGTALYSNVWNSIFADIFNQLFSMGPYSSGAQVQYWAVATDTSGNIAQSGIGTVQFLPPTGTLRVTINPSSATNNGGYRANGGAWQSAGTVQLPVGSYTIIFNPVSGFITPTNQTVNIGANELTQVTATYGTLALSFTQPPFGTNGIDLLLNAPVGTPVSIEVSEDMVHWFTWTNVTVPYSPYPINDPTATDSICRFYRAVTGIIIIGGQELQSLGNRSSAISLSFPAGGELYVCGVATGGAYSSTPFISGQSIQIQDGYGNVSAELAVATNDSNSYTTGSAYHVIGGCGVLSGNMFYLQGFYGANPGPGPDPATSVQFTLSSTATVLVIGTASGQNLIMLTGLNDPIIDVPAEPSVNGTMALVVEHQYLQAGTYTIEENTAYTQGVEDVNNDVDLIGVLIFSATPNVASSTNSVIPLPAGF